MDGLARVSGDAATTINIGGKTYRMRRGRLRIFAEAEAYLTQHRPSPIAQVMQSLGSIPKELQERALQLATQAQAKVERATFEDVQRWLLSFEGCAFLLWKLIDEFRSFDEAATVLGDLSLAEFEQVGVQLAHAAGVNDLGESVGLKETQETRE